MLLVSLGRSWNLFGKMWIQNGRDSDFDNHGKLLFIHSYE